jgi:hypothetical protein
VKVNVPEHTIVSKDIKLVNKTGMVAWYNFNGNADDSSGNNKHATLVSGALLTADFLGRSNHAYSFDGINDYMEIPDLWGVGKMGVTISAWINTAVLNAAEHIVLYQGDDMGNGTCLGVGDGNGVYFAFCLSDLSVYGISSLNALTTDTWIHIAGTWYKDTTPDPDMDVIKVYINGVKDNEGIAETDFLLNTAASGDPNAIGALARVNHYFNGKIADIRVYERALRAAEIEALAQQ